MKKKSIDVGIGLDDAELIFYRKENSSFLIEILAWNESRITVVFEDVIRVLDNDVNAISRFHEVLERSQFLDLALTRLYVEKVPEGHPYKHYQLIDNDDCVALEIVSAGMIIKQKQQAQVLGR